MGKKRGIPGVSFSWKRATGITKMKSQIARATGIPTTRAGRERKVGKAAGCLIPLICIALASVSLTVFAFQSSDDMPERGAITDLQNLRKVYIATEDDDAYKMISKTLKGYKQLEIVTSPKDAEFILEYRILTRDVAAGRGGADMAKRSQLRAVVRRESSKIVAWSETETLDVNDGFTFSRPNEINLTLNFIKAHKKAFSEKKKN